MALMRSQRMVDSCGVIGAGASWPPAVWASLRGCSTIITMGLLDYERLTRLTIRVSRAQRRRLGERARRGVIMTVARAALDRARTR